MQRTLCAGAEGALTVSPAHAMPSTIESSSPLLPDADPWHDLSQAVAVGPWSQAWLRVLLQSLLQARAGVVLLIQPDGSYAPLATWPAGRDVEYLAAIATESLRQHEGVVQRDELGHVRIAYPLQHGDTLHGAVVADLGAASEAELERALRLTHWGAGWLLEMIGQRAQDAQGASAADGAYLLDTLLALFGERSLREAGLALVNRIGRRFDCRQVQLGIARKGSLRLLAVSHAADFVERAQQAQLAVQAMHEAYDQRAALHWPPREGETALVNAAHRRYGEASGAPVVYSLPLADGANLAGVLTLERDLPFNPAESALLAAMSAALAPWLELRRFADQGAAARLVRTSRRWLGLATDASYPAVKLGIGVAALVLVLLTLWPATLRISAQAVVEGAVQRAVVAPFEGFLREAPARAGDTVKPGQVLAVLDDKDLRLEKLRWEAELEVALGKEREAMAASQRVNQRLAAAQGNQARANLDLVLSKLDRATLTAPFDAVVVKGDLSQQLGSPLEQGKVLFELAPLDSWRVILKVDERDIGHVREGSRGELRLSSLPGSSWPFTVKKVMPISVAEEGRNLFRVEASLGEHVPMLSPNMEGVGKIDAGRSNLLWIWSRPFVEWLRLAWWKLMP